MANMIGGTYKTTKDTPVYELTKRPAGDELLQYVFIPRLVTSGTLPKGTLVKPSMTGCSSGDMQMLGGCAGGESFWYTDKGIVKDTGSLRKVADDNGKPVTSISGKNTFYLIGGLLIVAAIIYKRKKK